MSRILLVAEGTFHRPLVNTLAVVAGTSVTLLIGLAIIRSGLPTVITLPMIVALLLAAAYVNARYGGPREFRLEKRPDDEALRLVGRFDNGELGSGAPGLLREARLERDTLRLLVERDGQRMEYHLTPPGFGTQGMQALERVIDALGNLSPDELARRYNDAADGIKVYKAKDLLLLRFTQKPGYAMLLWLIAAATMIVWVMIGAVIGTGV